MPQWCACMQLTSHSKALHCYSIVSEYSEGTTTGPEGLLEHSVCEMSNLIGQLEDTKFSRIVRRD